MQLGRAKALVRRGKGDARGQVVTVADPMCVFVDPESERGDWTRSTASGAVDAASLIAPHRTSRVKSSSSSSTSSGLQACGWRQEGGWCWQLQCRLRAALGVFPPVVWGKGQAGKDKRGAHGPLPPPLWSVRAEGKGWRQAMPSMPAMSSNSQHELEKLKLVEPHARGGFYSQSRLLVSTLTPGAAACFARGAARRIPARTPAHTLAFCHHPCRDSCLPPLGGDPHGS